MNITCAQLDVEAGKPQVNIQKMKTMIDQVRGKTDLIVFNEMCVSGYFLADRYNDLNWLTMVQSLNETIRAYSQGIGVIWGNIYLDHEHRGTDGRIARYNAAYFAYNGEWVKRENGFIDGLYLKQLLPNYRVFDDERYFGRGEDFCRDHQATLDQLNQPFLFPKTNKRIGIQICEDLWSEDYNYHPTELAINQKADYIVNLSSSPWTRQKEQSRVKQIKKHVDRLQGRMVPMVYANIVGMQNTGKSVLVFDGGSSVYDKLGERVDGCNDDFKEAYVTVDLNQTNRKVLLPLKDKLFHALICAIQHFDDQLFPYKPKWIVGVSGGLDSSVNTALLTIALGQERVMGVNMATRYNQLTTIQNAQTLCTKLQIAYREGSIEPLVEASEQVLKEYGYHEYPTLVLENIQARQRGHLLSSIAAIEQGVILNNGNKVENALGYATLYGDTIGALSVLGDCTKLEVVALGRIINEYYGDEIVPENLLATLNETGIQWDMAPSAELKDNQVDPMKWGYHDALVQWLTEYPSYRVEQLMQMYLDGTIKDSEFGKWIQFYQLTPKVFIEDLEWVLRQMRIAVFKRIQMPPIVLVSRGAFGSDYRENQMIAENSDLYKQLKASILEME